MSEYEIVISVTIAIVVAGFTIYWTGRDIRRASDKTVKDTVTSIFFTEFNTDKSKSTLAKSINQISDMPDALVQITNIAKDIHQTTVEVLKEVKK
jgi:hypothetical protein